MASKTDSTKVMWRIEYRKDRKSAWKKRPGLFEVRDMARCEGRRLRVVHQNAKGIWVMGYGFANTRVVKHVRGGGR